MGKNLNGKELGKYLSQRKDGRYEARYTDNFGKRHSICDKKLSVVRKKLNEALYNVEHSIYNPECNLTMNEWFDIWVETCYKKTVKELTYVMKVDRYNLIVRKTPLGHTKLADIKPIQVQQFVNNLIDNGLNCSTVARDMSLLKSPLRQAVAYGYISNNPTVGVTIPQQRKKEKLALSEEQQELFLTYARRYTGYDLFRFLLLTGTRIGEALALTWEDIDFEKQEININKTLHLFAGERKALLVRDTPTEDTDRRIVYKISSPKTEAGNRVIPMTDESHQLLREMRICSLHKNLTNIVFHNKNYTYLSVSGISNQIQVICQKITEATGTPFPHISPHTFRHTFATRCMEKGLNVKALQKILGHSNINMTLQVYTHTTAGFLSQEMKKLNP